MKKILRVYPFSGFTLIELLVVISIIGILATLLVANFTSARERARDAQRKNDINQMQKALELYFEDNKSYPKPSEWGGSLSFQANFAQALISGGYLRQKPTDPGNIDGTDETDPTDDSNPGLNYKYVPLPDACDNVTTLCDDYNLFTRLENPGDSVLTDRNCTLVNSAYSEECYFVTAP